MKKVSVILLLLLTACQKNQALDKKDFTYTHKYFAEDLKTDSCLQGLFRDRQRHKEGPERIYEDRIVYANQPSILIAPNLAIPISGVSVRVTYGIVGISKSGKPKIYWICGTDKGSKFNTK